MGQPEKGQTSHKLDSSPANEQAQVANAPGRPASEQPLPVTTVQLEQWKEINAYSRHWETLLFENSKNLFTLLTLTFGAAGAVLAWTSVSRPTQRLAIELFLWAAIVIASFALVTIFSTRNHLKGFYQRRKKLEEASGLQLKEPAKSWFKRVVVGSTKEEELSWSQRVALSSGWTPLAVAACFLGAIFLAGYFILATRKEPDRPFLKGARLMGANLSFVEGLTQADLEGACGDAATKLPVGLTLEYCREVSAEQKSPQPSGEQKQVQPSATSAPSPAQSR